MIKKMEYIYYSTMALDKLIKKEYKLFAIGNKSYLYNYI